MVRDDDCRPPPVGAPTVAGTHLDSLHGIDGYVDTLSGLRRDVCGALTGTADAALCLVQPRTAGSVRLVRQLVDQTLDALGVDRACRDDVAVAVGEACANTVMYGYGGTCYRVAMWVDGTDCLVEVADNGVGFELDQPPSRPDPRAGGGYGLFLLTAMVDDWRVARRQPRGTQVLLAKRLHFTGRSLA
jgi:serine/threonine-protein kinase RsbW